MTRLEARAPDGPNAAPPSRLDRFAPALVAWQRRHGRHDMPWQRTRDPYRVWLSEVMLQQTQVATVLGYYERFLSRFPDVRALAAAPLDDVLALWSGLGYYSRARNLHACAQAIVAAHEGHFPSTSGELAGLPGIGRSTAAAIAAFCFGERVAILDGNVKRVLTRVLAFGGDLSQSRQESALWQHAQALLPARQVEVYTQGLMDLGATLCLARDPRCDDCPVRGLCAAREQGQPERYPVKTRKLLRHERSNAWLWLVQGQKHWLVQRPLRGVWAGLWSLPEFDDANALAAFVQAWPGRGEALPLVRHSLTHFDWSLAPLRWTLPARLARDRQRAIESALGAGRWFGVDEALASGLPAPVRLLLGGSKADQPITRWSRR